jgi:hypothetical protein
VLYEHLAVSEAAVIGVPHPTWEEVAAAVVLRCPATTDELRQYVKDRVAACVAVCLVCGCAAKGPTGKIVKGRSNRRPISRAAKGRLYPSRGRSRLPRSGASSRKALPRRPVRRRAEPLTYAAEAALGTRRRFVPVLPGQARLGLRRAPRPVVRRTWG